MIDISASPSSRKRLEQRIVEVMAQVQTDLLDMITGYPALRTDASLLDPEKRLPRAPTFEVDGRPGRTGQIKHNLLQLTEEFLAEVRLRRRDKGYNAMVASMRLLAEFFGPNLNVKQLRRRQASEFRDFIRALPSNYRKRYPKTPLKLIPEVRKSEHPLMSYANVNKILRHLSQFLWWREEVEAVDRAPSFKNFTLRDPVSEKEKRLPFTPEQLRRIFSSPEMHGEVASGSILFWAYVIGLYQGFRLSEIANLEADCINEERGTVQIEVRLPDEVFDRDQPGSTKTVSRTVPMHWVLIELGLPAFARARPSEAKLFEGSRKGVDGYASRIVTDQGRRFLDTMGIPVGGPTFHSLPVLFRFTRPASSRSSSSVIFDCEA